MFHPYGLRDDLQELRDDLAAEVEILECDREFEAMPEDWVYELAFITESIDPVAYPGSWIPPNAPSAMGRYTRADPAIGLPGDGGVTWTVQTDPPLIFVKPRLTGAPEDFRDFLVAEAILQLSLEHPETAIAFFGESYPSLQEAAGDDPDLAFRLAVSLFDAWKGLETREQFRTWDGSYPRLHRAWADAGEQLQPRIDALPRLLSDGSLRFGEATELACSAIKHDLDLPSPFGALDVEAFRERGASFAVRWTETTVDQLDRPPG